MSATLELVRQADAATVPPDRLAHIVRRTEWPRALCGYIVRDLLGTAAPGRDRCADCLRVARKIGASVTGYHDGPPEAA